MLTILQMKVIGLLACTTSILLGGCALHDVNMQASPSVQSHDNFPSLNELGHQDNIENVSGLWWHDFNRPELNDLISQSFASNQDIVAAIARIEQARANTTQTRSDLFPNLNLEGSITDSRQKDDDQASVREIGAAMSWELDIFDRIGSAALADEYEANARVYDLEALRLSLSAEVANAYFGAAAAHNRLQLLQQ